MFGFLKEKLSKAVKSISEKFKEKEEVKKEVEEKIEEVVDEKIESISKVIEEPQKPQIVLEKEEKIEEKIEEILKEVGEGEEIKKPELKPELETKKEIKKVADEVLKEIKKIEEEPKQKQAEKKSFIKKLFERAAKSILEKKLNESDLLPILNELETGLIEADVAVEVAEKIKSDLLKDLVGKDIKRGKEEEAILDAFKRSLMDILSVPIVDLEKLASEKRPVVLLFLGFNGSGKTTSIAKTANWLKSRGLTCVLAAADSWRAAAIEQLEEHANKIGLKVIKHDYGADPAAVVYDAIEHAKAKRINFVLADSAGRAHTNQNLMQELNKIVRVNKPDLKILVIDSMTGNDAVIQAREFGSIGVDAVVFTKIDVNEKGGAILSVTNELKKPILFLGIGQEYKDFEKFDAEKFVSRILE